MVFQREQAACKGRGFTGEGMLRAFKAWIVKTPGNTGPGWTILEDKSGDTGNPPVNNEYFIVVCNHSLSQYNTLGPNASGVNAHKILKVGYNTTEGGMIRVNQYLWWAINANIGVSGIGYHQVVGLEGGFYDSFIGTVDADRFVYDFRGGPNFLSIGTRIASTWNFYMTDEFISDSRLLEPIEIVGVTTGDVVAGTNVVLQLGSGQAANFTVDRYYYIFDINNNGGTKHDWFNYVKVTAKDANTITVDQLRYNFPTGSVIHPYPHRIYAVYGSASNGVSYTTIPYVSIKSSDDANWQFISTRTRREAEFDIESKIVARVSPDEENKFVTQIPWIVEQQENRAYGSLRTIRLTSQNQIMQMLDGRKIEDKKYVYAFDKYILQAGGPYFAALIPDFDENIPE